MEAPKFYKGNLDIESADEFTPEQIQEVDSIINSHKYRPGILITVLEEIQEAIGYIPKSLQKRVALGLGVPLSEVYGVVTFYHFFTMVPRGRHTVRCCLGTACYVRGGKKNLDRLASELSVEPGETTPDRRFSLETVRCLGACGLAPVMTIDEDTHRNVKPTELSTVLATYT